MLTRSGQPEHFDNVRPRVSRLWATTEDVNSVAHRHHAEAVARGRQRRECQPGVGGWIVCLILIKRVVRLAPEDVEPASEHRRADAAAAGGQRCGSGPGVAYWVIHFMCC